MLRLLACIVSILVVGCLAEPASPYSVRLLQANVGTALLSCDRYVYKLCRRDAEVAIAARIEALSPDVVALQEVLPDTVCDAIDAAGGEDDSAGSCHVETRRDEPSQLRRLLPDAVWETRCDGRNGYECVAIRRGRASFLTDVVTAPAIDEAAECDPGFSVSRVDVRLEVDGAPLVRVVNAHPQSTKDTCRRAQLEQLFGELAIDDGVDAVIVSGDMNLDPFSLGLNESDVSVPVWSEYVGDDDDDRAFVYASGPAERRPPYPTTTALLEATLDHVAVRGLSGVCVTQGAAPGTTPIDGEAAVLDHRALDCSLTGQLRR